MAQKRVKNNTATARSWVGQLIDPGQYYELQHSEFSAWADDINVYNSIEDNSLVVATATEDITDKVAAHNFIEGVDRISFTLATKPLGDSATAVSFTTIANYLWLKNRGYNYSNGKLIFDAILSDRTLDIQVIDITNNVVLGGQAITVSGFYSVPIINPTADARLELQIRKSANGGTSPLVKASALEFDII